MNAWMDELKNAKTNEYSMNEWMDGRIEINV